ncbi:sugar kinase [Vibrio salinus]|uniref:sugar kinase n=1 Tax=Vibrio salinus TaxID=2899784 RepID=UPI001E4B42A3|nr:sugar kinase [Vibrio salinus]MCE0492420.1 sugar kinase [Vibrio salinus]
MSNKKVAIIGECMFELKGQPFGEMQHSYGGDTLNTAVYLSRMSTEVSPFYITAVGNDATSTQLCQRWCEEGVSTQFVLRDDNHSTGLYIINVDADGERSFQYWRDNSAAKYLVQHDDFKNVLQEIMKMDAVYLSGISLAILNKADRDILFSSLKLCRQNGAEIIFDSNYRPVLWESLEAARSTYNKMLNLSDIALMTFDDEQAIWGDISPVETLNRLQKSEVSKAVVKTGSEGCIYQNFNTDQNYRLVPGIKVNRVVDTTSAGDSFNGAFLAFYLSGQNIQSCCKAANLLAGQVIQHKGAIIPKSVTQNVYHSLKANL